MTELSLAEKLGQHATPTLFEVSSSVTALSPMIKPLFVPMHLCGVAYPVAAGPGDNAAVHFALAEAPPGSILVVAIGGDISRGLWGEVMMEAAVARGIHGLVTDGAVRDTRAIRQRSFPVFCAGVAIAGTAKSWRGVSNQPTAIGQTMVRPGDFVVGDDDGVVVIPQDEAIAVLKQAQARLEKEATFIEQLRRGQLTIDLLNLRQLTQ